MPAVTVRQSASGFATLIFALVLLGSSSTSAQSPATTAQPPARPKTERHDSVEVVEHLSPEDAEDGKLNDLYQAVAQAQRNGACTTDIIQRYQFEVIPAAEKSTFTKPKNKFLFLANRDLGNCYLDQKKFAEAEASFRKILEYAPVWPGT